MFEPKIANHLLTRDIKSRYNALSSFFKDNIMKCKEDKMHDGAKTLYSLTDGRYNFYVGQEKPEAKMDKAAKNAMNNSRDAFVNSLPTYTLIGLQLLYSEGGLPNARFLGLPLMIGGVIVDLAKMPILLTLGVEELIRAGICKLTSAIFEDTPENEEHKRILHSFEQRVKDTACCLIASGFETTESLKAKISEEGIGELVGLSLLLSVYDSRHCYYEFKLASGKSLARYNCPKEEIPVYDKLLEVNDLIIRAFSLAHLKDLSPEERNFREAEIALTWVPLIRKGTPITQEDKPEAAKEAIDLVNHMIEIIASLKSPMALLLHEKEEELVSYVMSL